MYLFPTFRTIQICFSSCLISSNEMSLDLGHIPLAFKTSAITHNDKKSSHHRIVSNFLILSALGKGRGQSVWNHSNSVICQVQQHLCSTWCNVLRQSFTGFKRFLSCYLLRCTQYPLPFRFKCCFYMANYHTLISFLSATGDILLQSLFHTSPTESSLGKHLSS